MAEKDQLSAIEGRRRKVAEEIARLQKEDDELAVAERVLKRLSGRNGGAAVSELGSPRPSGAPTTFEMAELVLANAEKEGKDGLTAAEMIDAIRSRYWPGLERRQILPMIYQFAKKGRLHKTPKGKFKRVNE